MSSALQQPLSSMSPAEGEYLVMALHPFSLKEIGSDAWKSQRESIELLNFCSHTNAMLKRDDFVMQFLCRHEKLVVLVHELLATSVWRSRILPSVMPLFLKSSTAFYMYYQFEFSILNLIECVLFFEESVVALGDAVLELVDYCWQQVVSYLSRGADAISVAPEEKDARKVAQETPEQTFAQQVKDLDAHRCLVSLSILWFIIDRLNTLPLAVTNSVLIKSDLPVGLSDVIMLQPWLQKNSKGFRKYAGPNGFEPTDDPLRVCIPEAHTWFSLRRLLVDPECRKKYNYTTYKKDAILRVRRFLNDVMVDQIPPLADLQRSLEELSFLEPPSGTEEKFCSSLVIEQVPQLLSAINAEAESNEKNIKEKFAQRFNPKEQLEDAQRINSIFDKLLGLT